MVQTSWKYPRSILGPVLGAFSLMVKSWERVSISTNSPLSSFIFCSCHQSSSTPPYPQFSCDPWFLLVHIYQVSQCLWCFWFSSLEKELCLSDGPETSSLLLPGGNKGRQSNPEEYRHWVRLEHSLQARGLSSPLPSGDVSEEHECSSQFIHANIPKSNFRVLPISLVWLWQKRLVEAINSFPLQLCHSYNQILGPMLSTFHPATAGHLLAFTSYLQLIVS